MSIGVMQSVRNCRYHHAYSCYQYKELSKVMPYISVSCDLLINSGHYKFKYNITVNNNFVSPDSILSVVWW